MSIQIDKTALGAFRNVNFGNDDAIANLDGDKGVKQKGALGSWIFKGFRSGETEKRNNAARTELLKALGRALNIGGVNDADGKTTFSPEFINRLNDILGPAFKRDDFGIDASGAVASGKPLTQRRIKAIVGAAFAASSPDAYDAETYKAKLEVAVAKFSAARGIGNQVKTVVAKQFDTVRRAIKFLEEDLDGIVRDNPGYDPTLTHFPSKRCKYQTKVKNGGNYEWTGLDHLFKVDNYVLSKIKSITSLEHKIVDKPDSATVEDLEALGDPKEQIKYYVKTVLEGYIKTFLDVFLKADECGRVADFANRAAEADREQITLENIRNAIHAFGLELDN